MICCTTAPNLTKILQYILVQPPLCGCLFFWVRVNKEFDFGPKFIPQYMMGNMMANCFSIIYIQYVIHAGQQAHMSFVLNGL